jgi:very-short-patch-repair endonuclease
MAFTHSNLAEACEDLGLPAPPEEGSKRERINASFAALPDADLPVVAERILTGRVIQVNSTTRNALQDVLWAGQGTHEIPKRTRREIARDLDQVELVYSPDRFRALLRRLWVLDNDPFGFDFLTGAARGLAADIEQHVFRNPDDWTTEELFEQLGAFEAGDARMARFLEGLVAAEVMPDEAAQRRIVGIINPHLRKIGAELQETGTDGGYPLFSFVSLRAGRTQRPKNLIFASLEKPDIRFRDAINNDIEIASNADRVLVYDRPIGSEGIRWRALHAWWMDAQKLIDAAKAKDSLYDRLLSSLPDNSPPQRNLYKLYHHIFRSAVPDLPALLPEVWLHWDPKTVRTRGPQALLRHRMDFLLLLPHGERVVLEVDGSQHFTRPDGQSDTVKYADTMRGDRELKLSGYEVFRFGATELLDPARAEFLLKQFFTDLFQRFDVTSGHKK